MDYKAVEMEDVAIEQALDTLQNRACGYRLSRCLISPEMLSPALRDGWTVDRQVLYCGKGRQRLGGLFDCFFESYWVHFTKLRQVEWRAYLRGRARVKLVRRRSSGAAEEYLTQWQGDGGEQGIILRLTVDLSGDSANSIQVEIDEADGACLSDIGWYALGAPPQKVRLGIVITTYERESFVKANMTRLASELDEADLIVVNHGHPGLGERLADVVPAGQVVRFVDQENSGGAGGFTRGIIEHKQAGRVSHILLMDDDIDLPADLVSRIVAILSWADQPLCIGGAMFDYIRRTELFSAGDFLLPGSFGIGHVVPDKGCDVAMPEGVDFLARLHAPDFNGWWCFTFPLKAVKAVGLPMPCFIRGDDVEYGYRLKRAGWPTIGWPGVAVWHMPFSDKSAPWHLFYDRRNSLFANAIHRRLSRRQALSKLVGGFVHHLLRYDYDRVRAMLLGIAAFNQGALAMGLWSAREHRWLIAETAHYGRMATNGLKDELPKLAAPVRLRGAHRHVVMVKRLLLDLFWPRRLAGAVCTPPGIAWRPDYAERPDWVIEVGPDGANREAFQYNFSATWLSICRCAITMFCMLFKFYPKVDIRPPD